MTTQIMECSICVENIEDVNRTITECGHNFHSSCIFKYLCKKVTCPLCRTQTVYGYIYPPQDDAEEEQEEEYDQANCCVNCFDQDDIEKITCIEGSVSVIESLIYTRYTTRDYYNDYGTEEQQLLLQDELNDEDF